VAPTLPAAPEGVQIKNEDQQTKVEGYQDPVTATF